jgi:hypothetical protein
MGEILTGGPIGTFNETQNTQARYKNLNNFLSKRGKTPVTPELDDNASGFQRFKQGLKQNNDDRISKGFLSGEKGEKTVTNFMFYMLMAMALVEVSLFVDLYVTNFSILATVHTVRILVFASMITLAGISFSQGWRVGTVKSWYDVLIRFITLAIAVIYTVFYGLEFRDPAKKTPLAIGRLSLSCILCVYLIVMLVWGIIHWTKYEFAEITMTSIVFWSILGTVLSIFSIYGAYKKSLVSEGTEVTATEPEGDNKVTATEPAINK